MQITDYSHQVTVNRSNRLTQLPLEAAVAALFFLVPALLLFVLSIR